jgi:hypothetical protein
MGTHCRRHQREVMKSFFQMLMDTGADMKDILELIRAEISGKSKRVSWIPADVERG